MPRLLKYAVGVWVVLFAASYLSSIIIGIIQDRKKKKHWRKSIKSGPIAPIYARIA